MATAPSTKPVASNGDAKRRRTKTAPENETASERFKRLASARVSKAIQCIRLVGNLTGKNYEYSPAQVQTIIDALTRETVKVQKAFQAPGTKPDDTFTL